MKSVSVAILSALVGLGLGVTAVQGSLPADTQTPPPPAARPKWIPTAKGQAELGYLTPKTKVVGAEVVTTIEVKNLANGAIAGLKIEEFWWDATGNPVTGSSDRLKKPLNPGETATLTLKTPKDPRMNRNNYVFSHANGQIKAKLLATLK